MKVTITVEIPLLGQKIQRLRMAQRLTQSEVGSFAGFSGSRISELEREAPERETVPLNKILEIDKGFIKNGSKQDLVSLADLVRGLVDVWEQARNDIS